MHSPTPDPLPLTRNAGAPVVPPARKSRPDYAQVTVDVPNKVRNAVVIRLFQGELEWNARAGKLRTEILPVEMQAT